MNTHIGIGAIKINKLAIIVLAAVLIGCLTGVGPKQLTKPVTGMASAACLSTAPPTTYGKVTQSVTVATAGTYRIWSRIEAPDTTNNSYYFQVDGGCAYDVGDSASIPANTWTWVDYQDGTTSSTISLALTAGTHTLTYTGKEPGVELDKVMLLTDTTCIPTGLGTNCAVNDTTPPTVALTTPASGATVSGTVSVGATATDASGIAKVEFFIDGTLASTDTTSAYSYSWNTTTATNGTHTILVEAFDTAGNTASTTARTVTVNNNNVTPTPTPTPNGGGGDTTAPTVSLTAPATGSSATTCATVPLTATASDNVGVTKVQFYADGTLLSTDTTSPYSYSWLNRGLLKAGSHTLTAKAYDAAGNVKTSTSITITLTSLTKLGDSSGDGCVNALDLSQLLSHDGQNYPADQFKSTDTTVGADDLAIMLGNWTW